MTGRREDWVRLQGAQGQGAELGVASDGVGVGRRRRWSWVRPRWWSAPAPGWAQPRRSARPRGSARCWGSVRPRARRCGSAVGVGRGLGWPPSPDLADRGALVAGQGVTRHQFTPVSASAASANAASAAAATLFQEIRRTGRGPGGSATPGCSATRTWCQRAGSGPPTRERVSLAVRAARSHHGLDPVTCVCQRCGVQGSGHGGHDAGHGGADRRCPPHSAGSRARRPSSRPARRPAPCSATGRGWPWACLGLGASESWGAGGLGCCWVLMSSDRSTQAW